MKKYIIVLLSYLMLAGCSAPGRIGDMPTITNADSAAKVTVIRVSSIVGGTNTYTVALNGKDFFNIRSGQHTIFKLNKGVHFIAVKCFGGWTPTWKEDSIKFVAESNKNNYFKISPNFSCAEIEEVKNKLATAYLKSSDYIDLTKKIELEPQSSDSEY